MLRIPSWCEDGASIEVNGEAFTGPVSPGSYAKIGGPWRPGDAGRLPMPVHRVEAHPYVAEDAGRVALMRGPILFCVEGADNPSVDPRAVVLPDETVFSEERRPDLLGGVVVLRGEAEVSPPARAGTAASTAPPHPKKTARPAPRS